MLKVGIITFHFVNNFGGVLQAYALKTFIERKCHIKTVVIDYRNPFILFCDGIRIFPITTNIKEVITGFATLGERITRYSKIRSFARKKLDLTKTYLTYKDLKKNPLDCSHYVAGSDQIWNAEITLGIDKPYYLGFVEEKRRKISYAASFGNARLSAVQKKRTQEFLRDFDAVSVRESISGKRVEKITGKKTSRLIDPVFLIDFSEWGEMQSHCISEQLEDYILLYIMQNDESVYELAKKMKKVMGKQVVEIGRYGLKRQFVDKLYINIGPEEFIELFQKAGYVCTNSYHGVIFSIIFEKELHLVQCRRFRERMNNLNRIFGLSDPKSDSLCHVHYNRKHVRNIILKERMKAYDYLRENLLGDND